MHRTFDEIGTRSTVAYGHFNGEAEFDGGSEQIQPKESVELVVENQSVASVADVDFELAVNGDTVARNGRLLSPIP